MSSKRKGPYRVIAQVKNGIQVCNLTTDAIHVYSVHDLKSFYGDAKSAFDATCRDDKDYSTKRGISYAEKCAQSTEMSFTCEYEDGAVAEIRRTCHILCKAFYNFCLMKLYLYHLTLDTKNATGRKRENNRTVKPGNVVYVDIRFFGGRWYESLGVSDAPTSSYVMLYEYTH